MPKREPTLADQFINTPGHKMYHSGYSSGRKALNILQDKIRRAEKMVFGKEASERVGIVLRDIPELLVEQLEFARAPYDLCWIEYDSDKVWEVLGRKESAKADKTRDKIVGLLIDHNRVQVVNNTFDGRVGVFPFVYHLNTEWPMADQIRFCEQFSTSRLGIDHWLWGSVSNHFRDTGRTDYLRALRNVTMVEYTGRAMPPKYGYQVMGASTGDFKNVVALLLLLNQPSITRYVEVPSTRGWIGNNPRRFAAHHQVHVALDAHQRMVKFVSEGGRGETRRLHRVRGHYCHDETARDYARIAGCIHEWIPTDKRWQPTPDTPVDERMNWQCRECDGKRWWQSEHERGDAEKGYVRHDEYVVTP